MCLKFWEFCIGEAEREREREGGRGRRTVPFSHTKILQFANSSQHFAYQTLSLLLLKTYYTALTTLDSAFKPPHHEFSFFLFSHFVPSQFPLSRRRRCRCRSISYTHHCLLFPLPFPLTHSMVLFSFCLSPFPVVFQS